MYGQRAELQCDGIELWVLEHAVFFQTEAMYRYRTQDRVGSPNLNYGAVRTINRILGGTPNSGVRLVLTGCCGGILLMMKILIRTGARFFVLALGALVCTSVVAGDTGTELARSRQCLACHQIQAKRVGPSFAVIGERYAGMSEAARYLADTIRSGSRGKWGAIPMPAQPQVSHADAATIAAWILSLAESSKTAQH